MYFFRQPSDLEIWSIVCTNLWFPFMYVWDIVKDTAQLLLMVIVVGGYKNVLQYWSSFSSVVGHAYKEKFQLNFSHISSFQVIWCTFLSIIVPIILSGTIRLGEVKVGTLFIDILTAPIRPIILQYQLTVSKFMRVRILKQSDLALASSWEKIGAEIETLEKKLRKQARLQLGLETIFQLAGTVVLLCYGYSQTKTSQGLAALFKQENMNIWDISFSSNFILGTLLVMNLITFVRVNFSCIAEGYGSSCKFTGRMLLLICIAIGSLIRISSMTLYFAPTLGLFDLLRHYQGVFVSFNYRMRAIISRS